jgi:hypothetical protein
MSAETTEPVRISELDIDMLIEQLRRAGRPFTTEELAQLLQEIWRRRRGGR